jgi:hypothetical protein
MSFWAVLRDERWVAVLPPAPEPSLAELVDGQWRKLTPADEMLQDDPVVLENPDLFAESSWTKDQG